jgi:hypothetical protein
VAERHGPATHGYWKRCHSPCTTARSLPEGHPWHRFPFSTPGTEPPSRFRPLRPRTLLGIELTFENEHLTERTPVTISDIGPRNFSPRTSAERGSESDPALLFGVESSVDFVIGPEVSALKAMEQARALAALALPRMLGGVPGVAAISADVQAVLLELVDVTVRHTVGAGLFARIAYDGAHVTVSVGDMVGTLPAPEVEPGLYLVHRLASEVGQYAGDHGGRVTWAAVPSSR